MDEWRKSEWEAWKADQKGYESPLSCPVIGLSYGWGLRHRIEAFPPDAVPKWCWGVISTYFDVRGSGHLPRAGGTQDQDARFMHCRRILDGAMEEIDRSIRKAKEAFS